MSNLTKYTILKSPHVSEKANLLMDSKNQYVFKVDNNATKPEIKKAVEEIFKVKVDSVNILNRKKKKKNAMRRVGFQKAYKKAYVNLSEGNSIDFDNIEL